MRSNRKKTSATGFLMNKRVAVIGYGSQGTAQAQNLRDSGIIPIIGLPPKSGSRKRARQDRFEVVAPGQAVAEFDIIAVLAPDHMHQRLFDSLGSDIFSGKALIFAHGLSIAFGIVKPPRSCDVILVAPHGPGLRLRELYLAGQPFTAFWAVHQDASGHAAKIGRAYAGAIGCPSRNLFPSSFREEAVGDIFGEQAVLCGGLVGLVERGFETLVRNGLPPENAYLECVHQLDLIIDLIKRHGPAGMFERISKTAAFGSLKKKDFLFDSAVPRRMQSLYKDIENGSFARDLMRDSDSGLKSLRKMIAESKHSLLQKTHDSISSKLRRK
jgi:ketol-acid reductoisomerase